MFSLDNDFLQAVGLGGLPDHDKAGMLEHIREQLEQRVGEILAAQMTSQQSTDFLKLIEANDQDGAVQWLRNNLPHHKEVVQTEIKKMQEEIRAHADQIVQATNHVDNLASPPSTDPGVTSPSLQAADTSRSGDSSI